MVKSQCGKMKQHVIVSETKPNHILFKSLYKHCCTMQLAYNKVMKYRRISSGN